MSISGERLIDPSQFSQPRYDLSFAEMNALSDQLISERPTSSDKVVCYAVENNSHYANVARSLEREIFEQYFGNTAEEMAIEYGEYEDQSRFFLSVDKTTNSPVGVLRVIENGPAGLKTINDIESRREPKMPALTSQQIQYAHSIESYDNCWDVGTVAVRKQYRVNDDTASIQLYRALYLSAMEHEADHFVSIIDSRPLNKMRDYLNIPFIPLAGSQPFPYLGSKSSEAVYGHVPEFYDTMRKARWTSVKRMLARRAFNQLVMGKLDSQIHL